MDFTNVHEENAVTLIYLVPLLDPRYTSQTRTTKLAVVRQIDQVCEEWGLFQIRNHGIPVDVKLWLLLSYSSSIVETKGQSVGYFSGYNGWKHANEFSNMDMHLCSYI
jgi:hypothetical protein